MKRHFSHASTFCILFQFIYDFCFLCQLAGASYVTYSWFYLIVYLEHRIQKNSKELVWNQEIKEDS